MHRGPPPPRVRFEHDDGFYAALKARVGAHFEATGRARSGGGAMHAKTAVILGWFAASYALLLALGALSPWLAVALTISLALATAGIGFSVMHDANHGAYARSRVVNRLFGLALDLVGASSYLWRFKHNVQHHTYSNVDGMDADIDAAPFLRLAATQRRRGWHRWPHLYGWALYGVLALKWWFVDDVLDVVRRRIGALPVPRPRGLEAIGFVAGKLGAFTLGIVLAVVFQLAHTVPGATFHAVAGAGDERRMLTGFAEHQVRATVDFAPSNRLLGWYAGGLNFQIEHHLFPEVCHVHYPAIAPIVERTCREAGIPYRAAPTLRSAVAAHYRFLYALGRPVSAAAAES